MGCSEAMFVLFFLSTAALTLASGESQYSSSLTDKLHKLRVLQAEKMCKGDCNGLNTVDLLDAPLHREGFARSIRMIGAEIQTSGSANDGNTFAEEPGLVGVSEPSEQSTPQSPLEFGETNVPQEGQLTGPPNNIQATPSTSPESALSWLKESFIRVTERVVSANPVHGGSSDSVQDTYQATDNYYSDAFRASQGVQVFDDAGNNFDSVPRTPLGLLGVSSTGSDPPSVASFG